MQQPFTKYWKSLAALEKDKIAIALSIKCNVALCTVQAWGLGYRTPKSRSQKIITDYLVSNGLTTDSQTLFPNT